METKNILVSTDFSEGSQIATKYALAIAQKMKANVHFLHIERVPLEWEKIPLEKENLYPEVKAAIGKAKNELNNLENEARKNDVDAYQTLAFNIDAENIAEYANKGNYDLLIMGSHGAKGMKEFIIGSNAQKVIRNAKIPVLVVKKIPATFEIKNIVFWLQYGDKQGEAFEKIAKIAHIIGAQMHILHINTLQNFEETESIESRLREFCQFYGGGNCKTYSINAFDIERGINSFMKKHQMNVLATVTDSNSGLLQRFSPSTTEALVNHLDIPILSICI